MRVESVPPPQTTSFRLFRVAVTPIIPAHDINFSSQEECQPVRIRRANHLLIKKCVWIAHYESRLVQIRAPLVFICCHIRLIIYDAREKHAVKFCTVVSTDPEMFPVEISLK